VLVLTPGRGVLVSACARQRGGFEYQPDMTELLPQPTMCLHGGLLWVGSGDGVERAGKTNHGGQGYGVGTPLVE
jgi:hypothetical protein